MSAPTRNRRRLGRFNAWENATPVVTRTVGDEETDGELRAAALAMADRALAAGDVDVADELCSLVEALDRATGGSK